MKENQKMTTPDGAQVLLYPFVTMDISQSINGNISHMMTNNVDEAGYRWMLAPCDVYVHSIPSMDENGIFFWSTDPVYTNDGDITHVSMFAMHMDDISSYRVGQVIRQGERMYYGGNAGFSTGPHVHYEITKGHTTTRVRPIEGGFGCLSPYVGGIRPDTLFSCNDTVISSTGDTVTYGGEKLVPRYYEGVVTHTVSFDSQGGSSVASQSVKDGERATIPNDPEREDYVFTYWYVDKDLSVVYDFNRIVTKDITLYAGWRLIGGGSDDIMPLYFMKIIEGGFAH